MPFDPYLGGHRNQYDTKQTRRVRNMYVVWWMRNTALPSHSEYDCKNVKYVPHDKVVTIKHFFLNLNACSLSLKNKCAQHYALWPLSFC